MATINMKKFNLLLRIFTAQHATATCCRGCLEKWHKIEKTHILSSYEIDYIVSVIMRYLDSQMVNKK